MAAVCMAEVFQVAASCLAQIQLLNSEFQFAVVVAIYLVIGPASAALLYWLRFGHWFRLLLEGSGQRRMVLLLFALEAAMEVFFILQMETQPEYLVLYYLLVLVMAALITGLVVYLSQQVDEGELDALWTALAELDAGFDRRIGEKIQASTQTGNLCIPQVRSLLLAQGDTLSLRVSNPYAGTIDPNSIWMAGFSAKGKGRRVGLASYQRILADCPNTAASTSWAGGVSVQELKVDDTA